MSDLDRDATGAEPLLSCHEVTKRYRDGDRLVSAVRDVSLSFRRGELAALVGPSGSGKSTLLALLAGLVTPTRGDVRVDGRSLVSLRDRQRTALRRRRLALVLQELALLPDASVIDNVLLPFVPEGGGSRADRARADGLLGRFALEAARHTAVKRLSGGEKQRVALARALAVDPAVLLLDEPSAHLDAGHTAELIALLTALAAEGRVVLVATHDARIYGDVRVTRTVALRDGALDAATGPVGAAG